MCVGGGWTILDVCRPHGCRLWRGIRGGWGKFSTLLSCKLRLVQEFDFGMMRDMVIER